MSVEEGEERSGVYVAINRRPDFQGFSLTATIVAAERRPPEFDCLFHKCLEALLDLEHFCDVNDLTRYLNEH